MQRAFFAVLLVGAAATMSCKRGDETAPSGKTLVAVTADENGFSPSSIEVNKGDSVALAFTRKSDDTCAKEVVFSELDVKKELPLNKTVYVVLPTDQARTFTFTCGMQMYKSSVVVK